MQSFANSQIKVYPLITTVSDFTWLTELQPSLFTYWEL